MSVLHLSAEQLGLKPAGEGDDNRAQAYLHGQIVIAGCSCHVEAYEVTKAKDGSLKPVNPDYAEPLEQFHDASGASSPFQLATIAGRSYVIVIYPHAN